MSDLVGKHSRSHEASASRTASREHGVRKRSLVEAHAAIQRRAPGYVATRSPAPPRDRRRTRLPSCRAWRLRW